VKHLSSDSIFLLSEEPLDDIKAVLRITNTAYDTEITDLILAAKLDLGLCGLLSTAETDPLIKRAITLYCKANFGWDNPDAVRLRQSYEMLRNHLSLSVDYAFFPVTFTVKDSSSVAIRNAEVTFDGDTKTTSASGVAVFYAKVVSNCPYSISADGYVSDDDDDNLVDVSASTAVNIILTGV